MIAGVILCWHHPCRLLHPRYISIPWLPERFPENSLWLMPLPTVLIIAISMGTYQRTWHLLILPSTISISIICASILRVKSDMSSPKLSQAAELKWFAG